MRKIYFLTAGIILSSFATPYAAQNAPQNAAPMAGSNLGSVTGGDFKKALTIIEKKCTACHSSSVINSALAANKDMAQVLREMEKKGARLNRNETEVLGIYWKQQPLKKKGEQGLGKKPEQTMPAH